MDGQLEEFPGISFSDIDSSWDNNKKVLSYKWLQPYHPTADNWEEIKHVHEMEKLTLMLRLYLLYVVSSSMQAANQLWGYLPSNASWRQGFHF